MRDDLGPDHLYIRRADGTEIQLNADSVYIYGAAISPDGSLVAFAAGPYRGPASLFVIDAGGGQPVRIAEKGQSPAFSPDGKQIAFLEGEGRDDRVWVANVDGSDAHTILSGEPALDGADGLAWSPAGDRIAIGASFEGMPAIYTFAPDGSNFTKVVTGGTGPYWSPDGSQIAYLIPDDLEQRTGSPGLAIADADGSNVREFGFAASGPWHPGTLADGRPAPSG